jgi:hypothetical protein
MIVERAVSAWPSTGFSGLTPREILARLSGSWWLAYLFLSMGLLTF